MLIKSVDDTKLGGIANTLEDRNKIENDLSSTGLKTRESDLTGEVLSTATRKKETRHTVRRWGIPGSAILQARRILELLQITN